MYAEVRRLEKCEEEVSILEKYVERVDGCMEHIVNIVRVDICFL